MVANREMTKSTSSINYSYVDSRESVHLALFISVLNDLDIMAFDVVNSYLNALCQ